MFLLSLVIFILVSESIPLQQQSLRHISNRNDSSFTMNELVQRAEARFASVRSGSSPQNLQSSIGTRAQRLAKIFLGFDKDKDGQLTYSEVYDALVTLSFRVDSDGPGGACLSCIKFINKVAGGSSDTGTIRFRDFERAVSSMPSSKNNGVAVSPAMTTEEMLRLEMTHGSTAMNATWSLQKEGPALEKKTIEKLKSMTVNTYKSQDINRCVDEVKGAAKRALAKSENTESDLPHLLEKFCVSRKAPKGSNSIWRKACEDTRDIRGKIGIYAPTFNAHQWCKTLSSAFSIYLAKFQAIVLKWGQEQEGSNVSDAVKKAELEYERAIEVILGQEAMKLKREKNYNFVDVFPVATPKRLLEPLYVQVRPCCDSHEFKGCHDTVIENCVCAEDPSCCNEKWDIFCTELVEKLRVVDISLRRCGRCPVRDVDLKDCPKCGGEKARIKTAVDGVLERAELVVDRAKELTEEAADAVMEGTKIATNATKEGISDTVEWTGDATATANREIKKVWTKAVED